MKAFVITLDAIMALSFFLIVMVVLSSQTYQPRSPGNIYLKQLSLDTITVLEKTGRIHGALYGNETSNAMQDVIEATPEMACIDIGVYNSSDDLIVSALRSDCTDNEGLDLQTATRPMVFRGQYYIIRTESWFKKQSG